MPSPTTAEANTIVALPKLIGAHLAWTSRMHGKNERWELITTVVAPGTTHSLELRGHCNPVAWGFALLWNNAPIRRLDRSYHKHKNPDGELITVPHKHRWTSENEDRHAYVPIDIDFSSVNAGLEGFLAECTIQLVGTYQPILLT